MSKEADRLIAWLGEVHAVPPFDVGGLIRDVEAAAEERGRRRGVEERDELRALLQEAAAYVSRGVAKEPTHVGRTLQSRIDAALAPRDSGKEG